MSERHNFFLLWFVPDKKPVAGEIFLKFNIQKTDKWKLFGVFSMNGIENYPAAGEIFLENVILKVSQTHFSKDFYPKGGGGGGGGAVPKQNQTVGEDLVLQRP